MRDYLSFKDCPSVIWACTRASDWPFPRNAHSRRCRQWALIPIPMKIGFSPDNGHLNVEMPAVSAPGVSTACAIDPLFTKSRSELPTALFPEDFESHAPQAVPNSRLLRQGRPTVAVFSSPVHRVIHGHLLKNDDRWPYRPEVDCGLHSEELFDHRDTSGLPLYKVQL